MEHIVPETMRHLAIVMRESHEKRINTHQDVSFLRPSLGDANAAKPVLVALAGRSLPGLHQTAMPDKLPARFLQHEHYM
jgi:hypothetical protein